MKNKRRAYKILRIKRSISKRYTPKFQMYTPREKLHNCIWDFTLGDADDHPSIPHAHSRTEGYRLDAWTGDVYPAGKERKDTIGKLKRKELRSLHSDLQFISFANKQIEWYRENYPYITFCVPEWFTANHMRYQTAWNNSNKEVDEYTFFGDAIISE